MQLTVGSVVAPLQAHPAAAPRACRAPLAAGLHSSRPVPAVASTSRAPRLTCRAAEAAISENGANVADADVPIPVVKIDNQSDPFATIVTVQFGDRLGELLDTIAQLKNLGLNIRRAKINQNNPLSKNMFYITDASTSEKVVKSAKLEEIRLTILNNLLEYHPESASELAWGPKSVVKPTAFDATNPLGESNRHVVNTFIHTHENEAGTFTVVEVRTLDRPGLLVDIVRVLKDINVNVLSAEVDTEGREAIDTFFVTYHGDPLNSSMVQLVTNCLQYYLAMNAVEREESY